MHNWYKIALDSPEKANLEASPTDSTHAQPTPTNAVDLSNPNADSETLAEILDRGQYDPESIHAFDNDNAPLASQIRWLLAIASEGILLKLLSNADYLAKCLQDSVIIEMLLSYIYEACKKGRNEIYDMPEAAEIIHAGLTNPDTIMKTISMHEEFVSKIALTNSDRILIKEMVEGDSIEKLKGAKGYEEWRSNGGYSDFGDLDKLFGSNASWYKISKKEQAL